MRNHSDYFKNLTFDEPKLLEYGFIKNTDCYRFKKFIRNNSISIEVIIKDNTVYTNIHDETFDDEYIGSPELYINEEEPLLESVRESCFISKSYYSRQTERIIESVKQKYHIEMENPFDDLDSVVFRNEEGKWFGLIMTIDYSKITNGKGSVNILNLKALNGSSSFEGINGIYKAYHMNKKLWITITLDDTLSDEDIMKYIEESYIAVLNKNKK